MDGGTKQHEIKLIAEGTYGCIYRPGTTCDGKPENAKYLTKIQKNKRAIENESKISGKIRNIPGYTRFFAPILKQCAVKITKDTVAGLKQCEVFKDDTVNEIAEYVSTKIRYVGNQDLMKYLLSELGTKSFLPDVWKTHAYLLKAVQKMISHKIVHYDIKYNNIIFDPALLVPILIDFGLAFTVEQLDSSADLEKIFFVFEYYSWWPIDVVVCSYIMQEIGITEAKTAKITSEQLEEIFDVFLNGTSDPHDDESIREVKNDVFKIRIVNSEERMRKFKETYDEYFSKFVGITWWYLYEDMIQYADTWDSYSLAATYLAILDEAASANPSEFQREIEKHSQKYISHMNLLDNIVYSSPDKRPSLKEQVKRMPRAT
jgi:serine/threonine protein kinase